MAKRKSLSKKTRFEVFKRDSFTCQYCGRMAPDVVLNVDHIEPVSKGGTNDITNLITSCFDCNSGKSDRELSDDTVVKKQQRQLTELNARREQLEMMLEWRNTLDDLQEQQIDAYNSRLEFLTSLSLSKTGRKTVSKLLVKFNISELLDALDIAYGTYAIFDDEGSATKESVELMLNKVPGIAINRRNPLSEEMNQLYYIRGIIRNRFNYYDPQRTIILLKQALETGSDIKYLRFMAENANNWSQWIDWMDEELEEDDGDI